MAPTGARASARRAGSRPQLRTLLAERLRERLPEIEGAALTRLRGISETPERPNPDYVEGLRSATRAALEYLLAGVEQGDSGSLHPPPAVLVQARLAARNRVGLDTVVRRCFAGHFLFGDFLMEELERIGDAEPELPKRLLREQAALFDRMLAAVSGEHLREVSSRSSVTEKRRARLIERLLAGEPLDTSELGYELNGHHLAIHAKGPGAAVALRELAGAFDRRLLALPREEDGLWTWLGGREPLDAAEVLRRASAVRLPELRFALGEAGEGADGWRLSHRQAAAALPVAVRGEERAVRYAEVALLAAVLQDELLATSLRRVYLEPLEAERDGGGALRETLRAYFKAEGSPAAAAAALGITRQTVANRLRLAERYLARRLGPCTPALQLALSMVAVEESSSRPASFASPSISQPLT